MVYEFVPQWHNWLQQHTVIQSALLLEGTCWAVCERVSMTALDSQAGRFFCNTDGSAVFVKGVCKLNILKAFVVVPVSSLPDKIYSLADVCTQQHLFNCKSFRAQRH